MDQRWQRKTAWALKSSEVGTQEAEGESENHGKVQEYCIKTFSRVRKREELATFRCVLMVSGVETRGMGPSLVRS